MAWVKIEPKRIEEFNNLTDQGEIEVIAMLLQDLAENSNLGTDQIIGHIMWNYGADCGDYFAEVREEDEFREQSLG